MSSTRRAKPGAPLRQERYASSTALRDDGLKPALVALRCVTLEPSQREIVWYLQARSHEADGLAAVAGELHDQFADRIIPKLIAPFRNKAVRVLDAGTVLKLRAEIMGRDALLTRGDCSKVRRLCEEPNSSFTVGDFLSWARQCAALDLHDFLKELCLNPELPFVDAWYFNGLIDALSELVEQTARERGVGLAQTKAADAVQEAIEYAAQTGSVVMLNGANGLGKSFSARSCCARWPGRARYVQVPAGNDRKLFFRAFANAFHGPSGGSWKAQELQERVESILETSGVVPVIDDALQLLPDRERDANPDRIDWIVTALAERGLPAVLITNPGFDVRMGAIQERSRWSGRDFNERVCRPPLPAMLSAAEIGAVASSMLPTATNEDVRAMVHMTQIAGFGSLHFLERIRRSVEFVAHRAGASEIKAVHVREALNVHIIPSAQTLTTALANAQGKAPKRGRGKQLATMPRTPRAPTVPVTISGRSITPQDGARTNGFSTVASE